MESPKNPVKLLYITRDTSVLKDSSAFRRTIMEYAQGLEEIHVIVLGNALHGQKVIHPDEKVWIYPTSVYGGIFHIVKALHIAYRQLTWKFHLRPNVIFGDTPYLAGLVAVILGKRFKKRVYIQTENYVTTSPSFFSLSQYVREKCVKYVFKHASKIRVTSESSRDELEQKSFVKPEKISIVPLYVDINDFINNREIFNFQKEYPHLGFIIAIHPTMYTPLVGEIVSIVKRLIMSYPRTGIAVFGASGTLARKIKFRAQMSGISKHVLFINTEKNLASYYRGAHLYFDVNTNATGDRYLIEALASSSAVITNPTGVGATLFDGTPYTTYVCPVGDKECIDSRLRHLMEKPGARDDMRVNAKFIVEKHVALDRAGYISKMLKEWRNLLVEQ
jgi:glycosyltransferase involved in cell wall biosynthesis